jgi:hypothetical protein
MTNEVQFERPVEPPSSVQRPVAPPEVGELPPGFQRVDPSTKRTFYAHPDGRSQWEAPPMLISVKPQARAVFAHNICTQPPLPNYIEGTGGEARDDNRNIAVYLRVALPLPRHSDPYCIWSRFLRIAFYFHFFTTPHPEVRALLLEAIDRVQSWAEWASSITLLESGTLSAPPLQQITGFGSRDFISSAFQALREHFPEDARFLEFDFSGMCAWPDFEGISWSNPHITVPIHGVRGGGGAACGNTDDACRFFSHPTISPFSVVDAFVLPPCVATDECSTLRRALSAHMRVPSIETSSSGCSVVAVLSSIDVPTLHIAAACSLLPLVGPRLPEPLVCAIIRMCQHAVSQHGSSSVLLQDEPTSAALLAALQRCLDDAASSHASTVTPPLIEIDARDETGKWYQAFIVEGSVESSDSVLVHYMVQTHNLMH